MFSRSPSNDAIMLLGYSPIENFLHREVYLYAHTECLVQINPTVVSLLRYEERFL